ncbi:MAG: hypothetical protein NVSMB42_00610 [Herpetosiphon sp.]
MAAVTTLGEPKIPVPDLHLLRLLLRYPDDEDSVLADYMTHVANDGLLHYKAIITDTAQADVRSSQPLYNCVLSGVFILAQLRCLVPLTEFEIRLLLTAYSIQRGDSVTVVKNSLPLPITAEALTEAIASCKLDRFFPAFATALGDILTLVQPYAKRHAAHTDLREPRCDLACTLTQERCTQLLMLMKAADSLGRSYTLDERVHKQEFLDHLHAVSDRRFVFMTHRISDQRGSFTNLVHSAVVAQLHQSCKALPLLLYPNGVAYLAPQDTLVETDGTLMTNVAARISEAISRLTAVEFRQLIRPINMGITVDKRCLELNLPFETLFDTIIAIIDKRVLTAEKRQRLNNDAVRRTHKRLALASDHGPAVYSGDQSHEATAEAIEGLLRAGPIPESQEGMQSGELIRSYYIFLVEHLADRVPQPWLHLYALLDIGPQQAAIYNGFDGRMDRAYAIARELLLSRDEVIRRIKADGHRLMPSGAANDRQRADLVWYLNHVVSINEPVRSARDFVSALLRSVRHKQCVQCNLPLPTDAWMSNTVRSDIKVQQFSNRLQGGPGEPRKRICSICQLQYLLEKLNYREVRGEQTVYLQLFPYAFMTTPFIAGLRSALTQITQTDLLSGALRANNVGAALLEIVEQRVPDISFTTRTKEEKGQPYGCYLPRNQQVLANTICFPINPAGASDAEQFWFLLQQALLFQYYFGCKILLTRSATPPLDKESFGDLYIDLTPPGAQGLVAMNNYQYAPSSSEAGDLRLLQRQVLWLLRIREAVMTTRGDQTAKLIAAMSRHPLHIFHVAEALADNRARRGSASWSLNTIAEPVRLLALSLRNAEMTQLDRQLRRLAQIAKQGRLRGDPKSWKKNAIILPLDDVLHTMARQSQHASLLETKATAVLHLSTQIQRQQRELTSGSAHDEACRAFVDVFFDAIVDEIYQRDRVRLLHHEPFLRSAYHFYIQEEYRRDGSVGRQAENHVPVGVATEVERRPWADDNDGPTVG